MVLGGQINNGIQDLKLSGTVLEPGGELQSISSHHLVKDKPFIILGDFNQIVSASEHFSILPYELPIRSMEEFRECLVKCEMEDLETRGTFFT